MRTVSKIISFAALCMMFYGCNPETIPLKNRYVDNATTIVSKGSADSTWSKLSEIFTSNGLVIKRIDKNNGLIRTKESSIDPLYTFEDMDGRLQQPQAWVVLARTFHKKKEWKPTTISGQWSIQVVETNKGETTVNIDPIVLCTYYPNPFTKMEERGQSTGNLEKLLESHLSRD
jgi:hypothetical protein